MENVSDASSEEELLKLRQEGKINEDEYKELLAAMKETSQVDTERPSQDELRPERTSGLAIASLVLSLLGPICCIPAIFCGHLALRKIQKQAQIKGRGLALAGLIIGYVMLGLSIAAALPLGIWVARDEALQTVVMFEPAKPPKGASAHVTGILTEMDSCVVRVCKAADKNEISKMADVFDQINEYCDELQGKRGNPAPTADEWGDLTADQHREIMDVISGIENDAEGLRSITLDRDLEQSERDAFLKEVWSSLFTEKYQKLMALLEGDD